MWVCVNIASLIAQKSHECDAHVFGEVNGQARWCSHCRDKSYPRHGRFLDQFKGNPAAQQKDVIAQRDVICCVGGGQHEMTDEFVERVVSANVFGGVNEFSAQIKECAAVNSARLVKVRLLGPQDIGEGIEYIRLNFPLGFGQFDVALLFHGFHGCFAAHTAA